MPSPLALKRLPPGAPAWPSDAAAAALAGASGTGRTPKAWPEVTAILERVRTEGDIALAEIAQELGDPPPREVPAAEWHDAYEQLDQPTREALEATAHRVERFARAQREALRDLEFVTPGVTLGHRVVPLQHVGVYVPGGQHALPSSLLMCAIPARVAGVGSVTVCTPRIARETLAAAHIAKVDRLFRVGGAQAIAALAYGTPSIPSVDLIAGPGNAYVTAAKREVYGTCGIDALAGPSELIVIASRDADPALVAADLLAQAEHDAEARVMLLTDDEPFATKVEIELEAQRQESKTNTVASAALNANGCVAIMPLSEAVVAANRLAPEHLEVIGREAEELAAGLTTYGALFIGAQTGAVFGDYGTGPNHVLPTSGTARFTSGLSVYDFVAIRTYQRAHGPIDATVRAQSARLAECEGLEAHRKAILRRDADSRQGDVRAQRTALHPR